MLAFSSFWLQKSPSISELDSNSHQAASKEFTGRIDRKLSTVFISLFLLVLLVGSSSLYLLGSHLYKSAAIARQTEQIDIVEQISRRLEAFASMIQLAHLRGQTVAEAKIKTSVSELNSLLDLYQEKGGSERNIQELRQMVSDGQNVAATIVLQQKHGPHFPNEAQIRELEAMETIQQRIEAFIERMSAAHEKVEDRLASASHRKMKFAIGANAALLVLGSFLLLALNRYWHRVIVLPLRQLAQRSSEIAKGEDVQAVIIASRDEIGLLSHAFNRMALQIKEQQEKSKGRAILEERQRLAAELHDNLAQDLAFLRIKLLDWERSAPANRASTKQLLDELFPIVDEAYKNLREAIFGLRALALKSQVGLVMALGDFLKRF